MSPIQIQTLTHHPQTFVADQNLYFNDQLTDHLI